MTRQTDYHNWRVMTEGDSNYADIFSTVADEIDREALRIIDSLPGSHEEGRWFTRSSDRAIIYDDGTNFIEITPTHEMPDYAGTRVDRSEFIGTEWEFENDIDADITEGVEWADNADEANQTQNTDALGGYPASDYCKYNTNETISGAWTFAEKLTVNQLTLSNEPLTFPKYG